jgi:hypothetical protein
MSVALTAHDNLARSPVDIFALHGDHFRRSQSQASEQHHHGVIAPPSGTVGSNRSDERIDLLGRQMPRQSRTISLGHARNGQRKIRRCLAGLEGIPEEVPQMRRQGLITERWRPRRQVLQKADDIGCCDPRQISDLFFKVEFKKAVGDAPAM